MTQGVGEDAGQDPYAILGLAKGASWDAVRSAFIRLAHKNHPSLHPEDPEAAARYERIVSAFDDLQSQQVTRRRRRRRSSRRAKSATLTHRLLFVSVLILIGAVAFLIALAFM